MALPIGGTSGYRPARWTVASMVAIVVYFGKMQRESKPHARGHRAAPPMPVGTGKGLWGYFCYIQDAGLDLDHHGVTHAWQTLTAFKAASSGRL